MFELIAGGLAALGVGAAVMSFIFDELTEEEKRTQERILNNYDEYKIRKQRELNDILLRYKISEEEFYQTQNEQIVEERIKFMGRYQEETQKFIDNIYLKIEEQIENKRLIEIEIKDAIDRISRLNKNQKSMLRADAMIHLKRELQEARYKVRAYKYYLNQYKKSLKYINKIDDDFELFSFTLPEKYPYTGKLMFFPKSKLIQGQITEYIESNIRIAYSFKEDNVIEDVDENSMVPVMITEFDFNDFSYILSASKGYLKHIAINQTRIGIEAKVVEHREDRKIILDYKGLKLILRRKNLENPRRTPPCGATVRVYPINWDYSLYYDVEVSEKYQDSLKAFQFSTLPMIFSDETTKEFIDYISENEIENMDNEWKVGPLHEDSMSGLSQIKLQLGDQLIFSASIVAGEKNYFKFDKLLSLDENFKPEDIFIVMEATLTMVNICDIDKLEEDNYINMNNLGIMLFKEFKIQKSLKESSEGMFYFNKWAEITDKLINYLYKGPSVLCKVNKPNFIRFDKRAETPVFEIEISNNDEVKEYIQKVYDNYQKEFFIELKSGEYATIEFSSKADKLYVYGSVDGDFSPEVIPVYCKNFCYPEIQQKIAINDFRSGRLSCSELQAYILNGKNIQSKKCDVHIEKFYNKKLEANEAQKESVIRALEQEKIFLIQGPPGTGKTTVIREIIRQQLKMYPFSRILIVSQANVAIDNVLKKGFDSDITKRMIRCGHLDKIDDALNEASFDQKYNKYIKSILDKAEDGYNKDILIKWKNIINKGSQKYNANIGELLVKNHQIVGATCLGLMQRQIGLDRVEFDLVIIDEAGKALPAEMLIPLIRAKKVILIGDHKQLPPVINPALLDSDKIELDDKEYCEDELFSKSLFKRLYEGCPETNKSMLTTQYRMPAVIGKMISDCFYEGRLKNGKSTYNQKPIYYPQNLNFLDMSNIKDFHEDLINKKSVVNEYEAELVASIVSKMKNKISTDNKIAVICPYKGQKRLIIKFIRESGLNLYNDNIAVNTIDAYQGDESEIVIYCTTRSRKPTKYFSDLARLNVAFSRAKNDLLVIGSLDYFRKYGSEHILNKIADYIIENGNVIPYAKISKDNKNNKKTHKSIISVNHDLVENEVAVNEVCATNLNGRKCVNLQDIRISEDFLKTPPKKTKVENFKQEYLKYGKLSNCVKIDLNMVLVDGFAKYVAAKELNMKEIEVEFIN
ncbi:AAA domain-containing protein [uncultured Clostridium sp.]|uniref:AAA domain-containing protein n=1 Tax=uncultured Clostridium sp. TaxID=59620 RepID=UPI0025E3558F|nr:AAA domain-containing protein [uncultured Clostridium sp.]